MTTDTPTRTPEMGGTAKWAKGPLTSPTPTSGANPDGPAHPFDDYAPDLTWVRLRLEDANRAFSQGCYDDMRDCLSLANGMMRYLDMRERQEAAS